MARQGQGNVYQKDKVWLIPTRAQGRAPRHLHVGPVTRGTYGCLKLAHLLFQHAPYMTMQQIALAVKTSMTSRQTKFLHRGAPPQGNCAGRRVSSLELAINPREKQEVNSPGEESKQNVIELHILQTKNQCIALKLILSESDQIQFLQIQYQNAAMHFRKIVTFSPYGNLCL